MSPFGKKAMMIDRRLFTHFDWTLVGIVLLIASIGILNIYSTTLGGEISGTPLYLKQIFWLLIGLSVMVVIAFIEYRFYSDFAYIVYTVALLLTFGGHGLWHHHLGSTAMDEDWIHLVSTFRICQDCSDLGSGKVFPTPPESRGLFTRRISLSRFSFFFCQWV